MSERAAEERYCPICEQRMYEVTCPKDNVQTIPYSVLKSATAQLRAGTLIDDRYRIDAALGSGAMGTVYAATQTRMDRRVALKVLIRELMRDGKELQRFYREAKNASRIKHPNVVRVYDFGVDGETKLPFLAMELVEGRTLRKLLAEEGPLPLARTAELLEQVSRALVAAHELGIVHRDLKPDNMMVGRLAGGDEHVTVLDFGIAKSTRAPGGLAESLTASGVVVGTPRYMSPEQVKGHGVDGRTDLYALGCVMHEMLTGSAPFSASEPVALMLKHVNSVRPPLPQVTKDTEVQTAMERLHRALLHHEPAQRPISAARVATMLRRIARRQPLDGTGDLLFEPQGEAGSSLAPGSDAQEAEGVDLTDTYVKSRSVLTPVDSRAFAGLELESGGEARENIESPSEAPNRRRLAFVGISGALLLAVGAAAVFWPETATESPATELEASGMVPQDPKTPTTKVQDEPREEEPKVEVNDEDDSATEEEPAPTPVPPPPPKMVTVRLTGTPRGATVSNDGAQVCQLPCTLEMPASAEGVRYTIDANNYYQRTVTVTPDRNKRVQVRLLPRLADPNY
jgi:serine/threonine protein kinase